MQKNFSYTNQISDKQLQNHTTNIHIFKSPPICSNRAFTPMCVLHGRHDALYYSSRVLIYCKYSRNYWIILTVT